MSSLNSSCVEATRPPLSRETKQCGHLCWPSSTPKCCSCMDERAVLEGNSYPSYIDGLGWADAGARDDGYCPVCNTKNYDKWMREMAAKLAVKAAQDEELRLANEAEALATEADKVRAAEATQVGASSSKFVYSNGDEYEGDFKDGERSGHGRMLYADGSIYDGQWAYGEPEGQGTKTWVDGIEYTGEWRGGMMHGQGRYTMSDGYVMQGIFQNDEFVE